MENAAILTKEDIPRLQKFHAAHFPGQNIPLPQLSTATDQVASTDKQPDDEDDLGYYDDGVKRTLTDNQIAMFRNSEIQKLIRERKRAADREAEREERRNSRRDDTTRQNDESSTWSRHFDDAPKGVDTLMYDDEPVETKKPGTVEAATTASQSEPQKFQWPKLEERS